MRIKAMDLAIRIAQAYEATLPLDRETVGRLATALYEGAGVVGQKPYCLAVLASPANPLFDGLPICVIGRLGRDQWSRPAVPTSFLAKFFRKHCNALGEERPANHRLRKSSLAPAAQESLAPVPIGGNISSPIAETTSTVDPATHYEWYDLSDVPVGGIVYRLTTQKELHIFQRLGDDSWARFTIPNAANMVNISRVIAPLTETDDQYIEELEWDNRCLNLALVRQPPQLNSN